MAQRRIGIRELKSKLSECVREVRSGGTIVVTARGRSVARMVADASSLRERLEVPSPKRGCHLVERPATETDEACGTGAQWPVDGG